jgi:hypothetical protein
MGGGTVRGSRFTVHSLPLAVGADSLAYGLVWSIACMLISVRERKPQWFHVGHSWLYLTTNPTRDYARTANREPRTANREPRTANREPRTANREPRTANREPRTANCEL